jgi:hypothetical protein
MLTGSNISGPMVSLYIMSERQERAKVLTSWCPGNKDRGVDLSDLLPPKETKLLVSSPLNNAIKLLPHQLIKP